MVNQSQKLLSGELTHRLAAIDVGTNSIRLTVAEALRNGSYRVLDEERVTTRLGRGLESTGRIDEQAAEESLDVLRRFKQIAEGFQPAQLRAVATCAVREAENGTEFIRRARRDLGLKIEVISPEREARLAFYSVQRSFDLGGKNVALADLGGGSTEIVLASGNMIEAIHATRLGAVRVGELYGALDTCGGDQFARMLRGIDRRLRKKVGKPMLMPHLLIGSGGTFTSLAAMMMAQKNQADLPVRGYQVSRADVRHLLDRLRKMSAKARRSVPGLNPERADIIVAGLAIVDRIMAHFDVNLLQVHNRGVQDGLLLKMIQQAQGTSRQPAIDQEAAIDRLAAACGTDIEHGRHVARLAGQIYAQLVAESGLSPDDQKLLETAARLQDVGYLINYDRHHKHSYHLILNSRLQGFQPQELELIANVARYHRGGSPKKKHANFRQLCREDRERVKRLAAVLRLAGGLDRSHSQQVHGITLARANGAIQLEVHAEQFPDVDLWGARRRARMFEKVFKTNLNIQWAGGQVVE